MGCPGTARGWRFWMTGSGWPGLPSGEGQEFAYARELDGLKPFPPLSLSFCSGPGYERLQGAAVEAGSRSAADMAADSQAV